VALGVTVLVGDIVADRVADAVMDDEMLSENVALAVLDALEPIESVVVGEDVTEDVRLMVEVGVHEEVLELVGVEVDEEVGDVVEVGEFEGVAPEESVAVEEAVCEAVGLGVNDREQEGVRERVDVGEVDPVSEEDILEQPLGETVDDLDDDKDADTVLLAVEVGDRVRVVVLVEESDGKTDGVREAEEDGD
jgi:hypothetical protein